ARGGRQAVRRHAREDPTDRGEGAAQAPPPVAIGPAAELPARGLTAKNGVRHHFPQNGVRHPFLISGSEPTSSDPFFMLDRRRRRRTVPSGACARATTKDRSPSARRGTAARST